VTLTGRAGDLEYVTAFAEDSVAVRLVFERFQPEGF
jgi:hypothetical protein